MRYDVTLQRMGFRMQPNGLWGISLLNWVLDESFILPSLGRGERNKIGSSLTIS